MLSSHEGKQSHNVSGSIRLKLWGLVTWAQVFSYGKKITCIKRYGVLTKCILRITWDFFVVLFLPPNNISWKCVFLFSSASDLAKNSPGNLVLPCSSLHSPSFFLFVFVDLCRRFFVSFSFHHFSFFAYIHFNLHCLNVFPLALYYNHGSVCTHPITQPILIRNQKAAYQNPYSHYFESGGA